MFNKKYSDYLEINPSFESVVDIDADQRNANLWRDYIVGEDMQNLMENICQSVGKEAPDARRSFWIHGAYGTGKSYAAIFIKHLMEESPETIDKFLSGSGKLSQFRNRVAKFRGKGDFLVIWKTGCSGIRNGDMMLLEMERAIQDALIAKFGDKADLGGSSLIGTVRDKLADPGINWEYVVESTTLGDDYGSADELREEVSAGNMDAIKAVANILRQRGGLINNLETFKAWVADVVAANGLSKSGIFFIWDEFTEYIHYSDDHTILQQLSEFTKEQPLFLLLVVHRSQEMLDSMGKSSYQRIADRFHQTEFHITQDAAFDLIAGSINVRNNMGEYWKEDRKPVIRRIQPHLPDLAGLDDKISEQITELCPMHPMTIRLLSRVAESFAAAQRTMFRFMKDQSSSDLGFVGYISKYGPDDEACWLTPEWLWDYFFTRASDFSDKDSKAAEFIRHYEESRHLVESDENAHRVFKIAMLLLAVTATTTGVYGKKSTDGLSATQDSLIRCLAGVMTAEKVRDILDTLEECKILLRDEAANGVVRLQLPFKGGSGDDFQRRYDENDKKYSRYQMFSKDGVLSQAFEKIAWDSNDATVKRMKICVCCALTNSVNTRLAEVKSELNKYAYKLGLLIVCVADDTQYMSVQSDLAKRAVDAEDPRLTIALLKTPFTDEMRKQWLTRITKMELANSGAQTAAANGYDLEARSIIESWAQGAKTGSKIIAWNGTQVFGNQYAMAQLSKTIRMNVLEKLFPYAPEAIVVTGTAYKSCNKSAALAGITRTTANSQVKSVLDGLKVAGLLSQTSIGDLAGVGGGKQAVAVGELAKLIRDEMESGQKVMLGSLWARLQDRPFGYYNTIACGVLLGYVFSFYKNSAYSWTDTTQGTHILSETTLQTMVTDMVTGNLNSDYLSAGSVTFQSFREYAQRILKLNDVQVANETQCWHNMREAVTNAGAPFWALKYLGNDAYGSPDSKQAAMVIIDNIQAFIEAPGDRENMMSNVIEQFKNRGKLRERLSKAFQDKNTMAAAFRGFLFGVSPELNAIADKLCVKPEELSDKLQSVMQGSIYTWTEAQVKEKLPDVVGDYRYLDALNTAMGNTYHSIQEAARDLNNQFKFLRVALSAVETLGKPWFAALRILRKVSLGNASRMTQDERDADIAELARYGQAARDCLGDAKPALSDILEARGIECTRAELDSIYAGLKDVTCDITLPQFDKELRHQVNRISQTRNRAMLLETWRSLTAKDSVRAWCADHNAPLLWLVKKDEKKAIETLISVQLNHSALDQNVQSATAALKAMDLALLTDDATIAAAFMKVIGDEYAEIYNTDGALILSRAKLKLGNDMSTWDTYDLSTLQKLFKQAKQKKDREEKLENAKRSADSMPEGELRARVKQFLAEHPEFCDFVTK